jgi:SKICH domain
MTASERQAVDLDWTTMTASLHTEKTSFGHVAFKDVAETYSVGNDITLVYTISSEVEVSARDWIGLYKVGWRSTDNYVCYEWSPTPANRIAGKPTDGHVVFPGNCSSHL